VLAGLDVPFRFPACRAGSHTSEFIVSHVALHAAACLGAGTLIPELTARTDLRGSLVLVVVS